MKIRTMTDVIKHSRIIKTMRSLIVSMYYVPGKQKIIFIFRQILDFDFEKLCSISLSHTNVYACLVCGKYFQGKTFEQ